METTDKAFKEGLLIKEKLWGIQGESAKKTIERFSYRFLESLRKQDQSDITREIIRLYLGLENRSVPEFFVNTLKDLQALNQIGYAFLLGLNAYTGNNKPAQAAEVTVDAEQTEEENNSEEEV